MKKREFGFTLLEVLLSLAVFATVLLSLEKLQFQALKLSSDAMNQSVETNRQFNQLEEQRGFSLIEVMLSMVLALVLLLGITKIFISNEQIFQLIKAYSELQENARLVSHVIRSEVNKAGFFGCPRLDENIPVEGYGVYNKDYLLKNRLAVIKDNPDELSIIYMDDLMAVKEGDTLLSSDCEKIKIYPYPKKADLMSGKLIHHVFYIMDTGRKNKKREAIFALFMKSMGEPAIEIAEGLESFKVRVIENLVEVKIILTSVEAINYGRRLQKEWTIIAKSF